MKILSIDTSSSALGIALADENTMLAEFTQNKALTHSEKLMPLIDTMLTNIDENIDNVNVIACTIGPGSFTGIRIGAATANAFAMAKKIPVVGISSLEGIAWNFRYTNSIVISTMYAQRTDYYRGIYQFEKGNLKIVASEDALDFEQIVKEAKEIASSGKTVIITGEMPGKLKDFDEKEYKAMEMDSKIILSPPNLNYVRASNLCEMTYEKLKNLGFNQIIKENFGYVEPVYIRKPQAEVQYEEKMKCKK